jgi:hypothetical protein
MDGSGRGQISNTISTFSSRVLRKNKEMPPSK